MEEEWMKHRHLTSGRCFSMYFENVKRIRRFKITGTDAGQNKTALDCETGEVFTFSLLNMYKREYATLTEIKCSC